MLNDQGELRLNVRELAEQSGTTVRTVHYYIAEGLLPPARGTTRNATYGRGHLARLRLIAALRDEGLALSSIRARLAPLTDAQVIAVADELDEHEAHGDNLISTVALIDAAVSMQTFITDRLPDPPEAQGHTAERALPLSSPAPAPRMARFEPRESSPARDPDSARDYIDRIMRRPSPPSPPRTGPLRRPDPRQPKPVDPGKPEVWHHFPIEDGIELRVRDDRYYEAKGRFAAIVDSVQSALRRYGLSPPRRDRPD